MAGVNKGWKFLHDRLMFLNHFGFFFQNPTKVFSNLSVAGAREGRRVGITISPMFAACFQPPSNRWPRSAPPLPQFPPLGIVCGTFPGISPFSLLLAYGFGARLMLGLHVHQCLCMVVRGPRIHSI